jgi:hypothetical protein
MAANSGFLSLFRGVDPDAQVDDFFAVEPGDMIHVMACSAD